MWCAKEQKPAAKNFLVGHQKGGTKVGGPTILRGLNNYSINYNVLLKEEEEEEEEEDEK